MPAATGKSAIEGLNARQREAVTHRGGPLIVLAGPGTGKTRVIVHRVAHLIESGVRPESIVAVTYTVKAAREVQERLLDLVGYSASQRVTAKTFHGFGRQLVWRYRDYLGLPAQLKLIDTAIAKRMLRGLVREHDLFPRLVPAGRDSVLDEAAGTIEALASNAVFPEQAEQFAVEWDRRLRKVEGDAEEIAAERERQDRFAQIARLYGLFGAQCRSRGWMTFSDLILWPVWLLREKAPAASLIRDQYRHYVVDEFQDANQSQIEFLKQLCPLRKGRPGPDLCAVGDDDQAIYEFRGADERAFARFASVWPDPRVVALEENYRAESRLIEATNATIARAEGRFEEDKSLRPCDATAAREALAGSGLECVSIDDDQGVGGVIAAAILADRAANPQRPLSAYAVVARGHNDLDRIGPMLHMEGLPVRVAKQPSALNDPGVKDLLKWIEFLVTPPIDDAASYAAQWLLSRPPFGVPGSVLMEWARSYSATRSRDRLDLFAAGGRAATPPFEEWARQEFVRDPRLGPVITRFCALATDLREAVTHAPADAAVFEIIRRADLAHAELLDGQARAARVGRLAGILKFVRGRLEGLEPPGDLASFWSYYNDLSKSEQGFRDEGEDKVDGPESRDEDLGDAVTLLTAHAAKGLEFDTVFVVRVRSPHGFPSHGDDRTQLPPGLLDRLGDERSTKERALAEERRVFYVACTRARRRLVLLAKRKKKRSSVLDFFDELAFDPPACAFAVRRDASDVFAEAAKLGVRMSSRSAIDDAGPGVAVGRAEILRRARRDTRLGAAQALDSADRPDAPETDIAEAVNALRDGAQFIAAAAHLEKYGELPAWARGPSVSPGVRDRAAGLADALASTRPARPFAAELFKPLTPPFKLSFSWIRDYDHCPRCFYLQRVLRVPEPQVYQQIVGTTAHDALAAFYEQRRAAEADGRPGPTLDDLLQLGRDCFNANLSGRTIADPEHLNQVLAQLELVLSRLDNPADEVEQTEFVIRFPWERAGHTHTMEAKIDRLDRLPPPALGHRIIDYKTGKPKKAYTEPEARDLQFGIYSMALHHHQTASVATSLFDTRPSSPTGETAVLAPGLGVAEYWLLATGERGRIDLADLDYGWIKSKIDEAIDGMAAGAFGQGEDCNGFCEVFARE